VTSALYIAAKAPRPGHVKTRLAAAIGEQAAAELYRAFLRDLAARFPEAGWYVTPLSEWRAARDSHSVCSGRVLEQPAGDWTARQQALFRGAAARGEERVVLIASDSPQLRSQVVEEAFRLLDRRDLVLGPVGDGGYYLIGMRGWHDVLAGIPMSTDAVLDEILESAAARGLSVGMVESTYDVDEVDDLELLELDAWARDDLPATRAALSSARIAVLA